MPGSGRVATTTASSHPVPALSSRSSSGLKAAGMATRAGASTRKSEPASSMGGAAGGSSGSRSRAFTTVTATSSVDVTAVGRQPESGSMALTQGGLTSTYSSTAPRGSSTDAV